MTVTQRGVVLGIVVVLCATAAAAAVDPRLTCESSKRKTAGEYNSCRLDAEAKAAREMTSPDFSKCDDWFSTKWQAAETKAGAGVCPTEGDEADLKFRISEDAHVIATLLAGGTPVECGNGVADGDDQCDGSDLGGETCEGLGYALGGPLACTAGCGFDTSGCMTERIPASGQTTSYGSGDDGDVRPGAGLSYRDNGDGTITDRNTGLMWEKKIGDLSSITACSHEAGSCADPHRVGNYYTWSTNSAGNYDGDVVTIFLRQLNDRCDLDTTVPCTTNSDCSVPGGECGFAGHRDWRLPSVKELVGIVDYDIAFPRPTVSAAFDGASCGAACTDITDPVCSCTQTYDYWSSSTYQNNPAEAWIVGFYDGNAGPNTKSHNAAARAVRGGS